MKKRKIKIAQIGVEHDHAADIMTCMRALDDVFEVVGYAKVDECDIQFTSKISVYEGIPEMSMDELLNYPDLDGVTVETTEKNLTKYALLAADNNLHIHMDKPGGESLKEFARLITTMKRKALVLHMGYMYRYNPAVMKLHELVNQGKLGEIYGIEAQMSCEHDTEKRKWLGQFKGGMMFFLGCHLIDLIKQFQGEPQKITSVNKCTGADNVNSVDYGFATFEYKNGVSFCKTVAHEVGGGMRRQLVLNGSKGTGMISPLEAFEGPDYMMSCVLHEIYSDEQLRGSGWKKTEFSRFSRYNDMLEDFAEIVQGKKESLYTYEYELSLYQSVLDACGHDVA